MMFRRKLSIFIEGRQNFGSKSGPFLLELFLNSLITGGNFESRSFRDVGMGFAF